MRSKALLYNLLVAGICWMSSFIVLCKASGFLPTASHFSLAAPAHLYPPPFYHAHPVTAAFPTYAIKYAHYIPQNIPPHAYSVNIFSKVLTAAHPVFSPVIPTAHITPLPVYHHSPFVPRPALAFPISKPASPWIPPAHAPPLHYPVLSHPPEVKPVHHPPESAAHNPGPPLSFPHHHPPSVQEAPHHELPPLVHRPHHESLPLALPVHRPPFSVNRHPSLDSSFFHTPFPPTSPLREPPPHYAHATTQSMYGHGFPHAHTPSWRR